MIFILFIIGSSISFISGSIIGAITENTRNRRRNRRRNRILHECQIIPTQDAGVKVLSRSHSNMSLSSSSSSRSHSDMILCS